MTPEDTRQYESKPQQRIDPETLKWLRAEVERMERAEKKRGS